MFSSESRMDSHKLSAYHSSAIITRLPLFKNVFCFIGGPYFSYPIKFPLRKYLFPIDLCAKTHTLFKVLKNNHILALPKKHVYATKIHI